MKREMGKVKGRESESSQEPIALFSVIGSQHEARGKRERTYTTVDFGQISGDADH